MKIIIVGCGKVGTTLAEQLNNEHHDITIIDKNTAVLSAITERIDVMGVVGNGAVYKVQMEAGIQETDLLIATTNSDELNMLCCLIAKKAGNCHTIARIRNPEYNSETRYIREELGLQVVLGVSNISFGLPNRKLITQNFLIQAMHAGLTLPIINPNQTEMMDAVAAYRVLSGEDRECRAYVARFAAESPVVQAAPKADALTLGDAVIRGLKADAGKLAAKALETEDELSLVENHLIPALDKVGEDYDKGTAFLPQLLSAAQAAQAVFEVIRSSIAAKGGVPVKKGKLIVATVQGDIHDIGKNIVKTVLGNYGYEVLDLGRDVPPETILRTVQEQGVRLVGLSALMTTTLPAMEKTIRLLHTMEEPPVIFVGGAVVTPEYAKQMNADYYAKDAHQSVEITRKVMG